MSEEGVKRRLAAIFAADVVGFSRLMGEDEAGTLARLKTLRKDLVQPEIAGGRGRIVKLMGDGLLAEFPSVVEAVRCAIGIQQCMAGWEADLPEERRIRLRIGVNLGDIIVEGSDIYGDGVNVAARLEGLAETGGICISGKVYNEVENKLTAAFEDLGEQEVKNIREPVRVYRWTAAADTMPGTAGAEGALTLPDKPSIAVLPFTNMSGDPEQEFFADGMAEDIITALSRSSWLFIIARNTTFSYKGEKVDVKRVAQELGVRYVLEGSVRKAGNRIRVTAQLIDGATGGHVWSERYDGELAEIFDLQDEITRNVVASIQTQVHLTASEPAKKSKRPDLTVWELTMRGWQLLYDFSSDSYTTAKTLLDKAIARDPNSAEAHLVLAVIHYHDAILGFVKDTETSSTLARKLALRATRLDNQNEYAHWALGLSCLALARYEESIAALERAIALNPNCSVAYQPVDEVGTGHKRPGLIL